MECKIYLRNVQGLLSDGRPHMRDVLGNHLKDRIIPFGSLNEYYLFLRKDPSRIHQFGKTVFPGLFLGYVLYAGGIWKGWHIGCRHWGVGNDGRIRNLLRTTQCKGSDISQRKWKIFFQPQMDESNFLEEVRNWEHPHLDTGTSNSRRRSRRLSWRIRRVSFTTSWLISGCRWSDEWFLVHVRNFIFRHHVEPRVKLHSPREESFPVPLKYIDVSRTTHTNLDVKQQKRIDDYWNIDGSRDLSDPWTGFTPIYSIGRKTSRRIYVVREEIHEKTADILARSFMASNLENNGKEC